MLLAIESSCDETSVALFDSFKVLEHGKSIGEAYLGQLIKSQVDLHSLYGGVVPELAARQHSEALPKMVNSILEKYNVTYSELKHIAVTSGPGLKGCLLVGLSYAKGLSEALGIPIIPINHLEGHVLSYSLEFDATDQFPLLCLLVSGGHSEIVLVDGIGHYKILCETSDDAAGEAFDKIGTLLGIKYPAGKELSELARKCSISDFTFPEAVQKDFSTFSFSGLKTAVKREIESYKKVNTTLDEDYRSSIAWAVQNAIVNALLTKLEYWVRTIKPKALVLAGGVAANSRLRKEIEYFSDTYSIPVLKPKNEFCTDNAAMIGAAGLLRLRESLYSDDMVLKSRSIGAVPRWSLEAI